MMMMSVCDVCGESMVKYRWMGVQEARSNKDWQLQ